MKKWKIIRLVTLVILVCFIILVGYMMISSLLAGNFYSDFWGVTVFYWYERFMMAMALYLYFLWLPLLLDLILFIISLVKIKRYYKNNK